MEKHKEKTGTAQVTSSLNKVYTCEICGKILKLRTSYMKHMNNHNGKRHKCGSCDRVFLSYTGLSLHRRSHESVIEARLPYPCSVCDKRFLTKTKLKRHSEAVHRGTRVNKDVANVNEDITSVSKDLNNTGKDVNSIMKDISSVNKDITDTDKDVSSSKNPTSPKKDIGSTVKDITGTVKDITGLHKNVTSHDNIMAGDIFINAGKDRSIDKEVTGTRKVVTSVDKDIKPTSLGCKDITIIGKDIKPTSLGCKICSKTFGTISNLKRHILKHQGRRFSCHLCANTYSVKESLDSHLKWHEIGEPWSCDKCEAKFVYKHSLKRHERRVHSTKQNDESAEKETTVQDEMFPADTEDWSHLSPAKPSSSTIKRNNHVKMYLCKICNKLFSGRNSLQTHLDKHRGKTYDCDICGKKLTSSHSLKSHKMIHENIKLFICGTCGAQFVTRFKLIRHEATHLPRERQMICEICGKGFFNAEYLKCHKKVHEDSKTHHCSTCGQSFKHATSLNTHKRIHDTERKFKCSFCTRGFDQKITLENHLKLHKGRSTVKKGRITMPVEHCHICGLGLSSKRGLQKHLKKHKEGSLVKFNKKSNRNVTVVESRDDQEVVDQENENRRVEVKRGVIPDKLVANVHYEGIHTKAYSQDEIEIPKSEQSKKDKSGHFDKVEKVTAIENKDWKVFVTKNTNEEVFESNDGINDNSAIAMTHSKEKPAKKHQSAMEFEQGPEFIIQDKARHNLLLQTEDKCRYVSQITHDNIEACTKTIGETLQWVHHRGTSNKQITIGQMQRNVTKPNTLGTIEKEHVVPVLDQTELRMQKQRSTCSMIDINQILKVDDTNTSLVSDNASEIGELFINSDYDSDATDLIEDYEVLENKHWMSDSELDQTIKDQGVKRYAHELKDHGDRNKEKDMFCSSDNEVAIGVDIKNGISDDIICMKSAYKNTINLSQSKDQRQNTHDIKSKPGNKDSLEVNKWSNCGSKEIQMKEVTKASSGVPETGKDLFQVKDKCDICHKVFKLHSYLRKHMKKFHPDKEIVYKCMIENCSKSFATRQKYRHHLLSHNEVLCQLCSQKYKSTNELIRHVQTKHDTIGEKLDYDRVTCMICGNVFEDGLDAIEHFKSHRVIKKLVKQSTDDKNKVHKCGQCSKTFQKKQSLVRHKVIHIKGKCPTCEKCGRVFTQTVHMLRHVRSNACSKNFTCIYCKQKFHTGGQLRVHQKSKHKERSYECPFCHKRFSSSSSMHRHKQSHVGGSGGVLVTRPYMCSICGNCYTASHSLKVHMITHAGLRPHVCETCGVSYKQRAHLLRHVAVSHKGIRRFKCEERGCGKAFPDKQALRAHGLSHSGEKTHKCVECGKSFSTPQILKVHMKTHLETKEHVCKFCKQEFSTKMSLQRHLRRHDNTDISSAHVDHGVKKRRVAKMADKQFQCDSCARKFTTRRATLFHIRNYCPGKKSKLEQARSFSLSNNFNPEQALISRRHASEVEMSSAGSNFPVVLRNVVDNCSSYDNSDTLIAVPLTRAITQTQTYCQDTKSRNAVELDNVDPPKIDERNRKVKSENELQYPRSYVEIGSSNSNIRRLETSYDIQIRCTNSDINMRNSPIDFIIRNPTNNGKVKIASTETAMRNVTTSDTMIRNALSARSPIEVASYRQLKNLPFSGIVQAGDIAKVIGTSDRPAVSLGTSFVEASPTVAKTAEEDVNSKDVIVTRPSIANSDGATPVVNLTQLANLQYLGAMHGSQFQGHYH